MDKELSQQEFQGFVIEQFAKITEESREGFRSVHAEIRALSEKQSHMNETLQPLAAAFDRDAEKLVEHDRRVTRLEERAGIAS